MYTKKAILAVAPLLLCAYADVQLESENVPSACSSICAPIVELTSLCHVRLAGDNDSDDHTEGLLEAQCVCTNDSFSVSSIASTCAACIYANKNTTTSDDDDGDDDDSVDTEDIDDILYTCGWSRGSWSTASATQASGITVEATAPTASSQLTTTIVAGATNAAATSTSTKGTSTSGSSSSTSTENVITSTTTITSTSDDSENGASSFAPMRVAGAAVVLAAVALI